MKRISRYVVREFMPQFVLSFMVFTFILIMDKLFTLTSLIINKGVATLSVVRLFLYTLPSFATLTFPMAFLMGTLLTYGSMQEDNEITALRAAGVPQIRIITPLLAIALLTSIGLMYFNQEIAPLAQKRFAESYYKIAYQRPTLTIEENTFTDIGAYRLFVHRVHRITNRLSGVIIYKLDPNTYPLLITAQEGTLEKKGDTLVISLRNGMIQRKHEQDPSKFNTVRFTSYRFMYNLEKTMGEVQDYTRSIVNMTGKELKQEAAKLKQQNISIANIQTQYYQRIAIAWACLTFVLLAAPLAIIAPRHNKAISFGMSLVLIFVFYALLAMAMSISDRGIIPSQYALALPNIIVGGVGVFLLRILARK